MDTATKTPKPLAPGPGGQVIVARYGRDLEDFTVGDVYEHRPGRTLTAADNIQFSLLTMNRHPAHCDDAFAAKTQFGQALVNSTLTLAIVTGLTVDDVSARAIANLGWREVKLTAPVFVGDTLYARTKVLEARPSKSRRGEGVVTTHTQGYKQDGTVVLSFERISLVHMRGHGPQN
ncbi:MAG TPA: MaoC family dehydratase [Thermohalobaculum sp.]|nr:MaoC family dehydratase [Thermohalobaculum sp.]